MVGVNKQSRAAAATGGALVAMVAAFIIPFEGKRNVGYFDPSHIPTACWGHTHAVVVGRQYADAECKDMLMTDIKAHAAPVARCITAPVSAETFGAMVSFAYNAGPATVCAKFAPLINAGHTREACARLALYVYSRDRATGRLVKLPGLVRRRAAERALCERGIA